MTLYRVTAAHSDTWQLMPKAASSGTRAYGLPLPEDWSPPELILVRNRAKTESDFWDYDQDAMFAISERVAHALGQEEWCEVIPLKAEVTDTKGKPAGEIERHLLNLLAVVDVMDHDRTIYKPYGDRVLDFDRDGALAVVPSQVPERGLFLQPSGSGREILCAGHFRDVYEAADWSGLRFQHLRTENKD